MSSLEKLGDLGFAALQVKPETISPPSLGDLYSLWQVYRGVTAAAGWKLAVLAIVKAPGFRQQFKLIVKAMVAIDSMMDDPGKVAEVQALIPELLA